MRRKRRLADRGRAARAGVRYGGDSRVEMAEGRELGGARRTDRQVGDSLWAETQLVRPAPPTPLGCALAAPHRVLKRPTDSGTTSHAVRQSLWTVDDSSGPACASGGPSPSGWPRQSTLRLILCSVLGSAGVSVPGSAPLRLLACQLSSKSWAGVTIVGVSNPSLILIRRMCSNLFAFAR